MNRFNHARPGLYEQQKAETELIHQKWLESKAKKQPKSKLKDTGLSGGGTGAVGGGSTQQDHRNLVNVSTKLQCSVCIPDTASYVSSFEKMIAVACITVWAVVFPFAAEC